MGLLRFAAAALLATCALASTVPTHRRLQSSKACADIVPNGVIDIEDLLALLGDYGKKGASVKSDIVKNKVVDIEDLLALLGSYGKKTTCAKSSPLPGIKTQYIKILSASNVGSKSGSWDLYGVHCFSSVDGKKIPLAINKVSHEHNTYRSGYLIDSCNSEKCGSGKSFWAGNPNLCGGQGSNRIEKENCQWVIFKLKTAQTKGFRCDIYQHTKDNRWALSKILMQQSNDYFKWTKPAAWKIKLGKTTITTCKGATCQMIPPPPPPPGTVCSNRNLVLDWTGGKHATVHAQFGTQKTTSAMFSKKQVVHSNPTTGCTAFKGASMKGKIALVSRGTCRFDWKTTFAQRKGAIAIIIYNNGGGTFGAMAGAGKVCIDSNGKTGSGKPCTTLKIPAVFVNTKEGNAMRDLVKKGGKVLASLHCSKFCELCDNGLYFEAYDYPKGFKTLGGLTTPLIDNWGDMTPKIVHATLGGAMWYSNDANFKKEIPVFNKNDKYLMRWRGYFVSNTAGYYYFRTRSDDGSMVYVNNVLRVNNDGDHGPRTKTSGALRMGIGLYPLTITFYENGGGAMLQVSVKFCPRVKNKLACRKTDKFVPMTAAMTQPLYRAGMAFEAYTWPGNGFRLAKWESNVGGGVWAGQSPYLSHASLSKKMWFSNDAAFKKEIPKFNKNDKYIMRFRGTYYAEKAGVYKFKTVSDDGSRLYVNGRMVVNNDGDHGPQARVGQISLKATTWYPIVVTFYENGGGAKLEVSVMPAKTSKYVPLDQSMVRASTYEPPPLSMCSNRDLVVDWSGGQHASAHANFASQIASAPDLADKELVASIPKEGCKKFQGKSANLKGKIALVSRGACRFDWKTLYAQRAGALAIIIHNNGGSWNSNTIMGGNTKVCLNDNGKTDNKKCTTLKIPSIFLNLKDKGSALQGAVKKGKTMVSIHCSGYCRHCECKKNCKKKYFATLIAGKNPTKPNVKLVGNAKIDKKGLSLDGAGDRAEIRHVDYALDAAFTLSFWFSKTKCHGHLYEYLFSHQKYHSTSGRYSITSPTSQNTNINMYMGCQEVVGGWGTIGTNGKSKGGSAWGKAHYVGADGDQTGSFLRTIMKDDKGTFGLIDLSMHKAGDFDSITHRWVHVALTAKPGGITYTMDGVTMSDTDFSMHGHLSYANPKNSVFWPKPSQLQRDFQYFSMKTPVFLGGNTARSGNRYFSGRIAGFSIYSDPVATPVLQAAYKAEKKMMPSIDCKDILNGKNKMDKCGTCDANPANDCKKDCAGFYAGGSIKKNGKCVCNTRVKTITARTGAYAKDRNKNYWNLFRWAVDNSADQHVCTMPKTGYAKRYTTYKHNCCLPEGKYKIVPVMKYTCGWCGGYLTIDGQKYISNSYMDWVGAGKHWMTGKLPITIHKKRQPTACAVKDLAIHWEGRSAHTVHAQFGSQRVTQTHVAGKFVVAANPLNGCTALKGGWMTGKVALIKRGTCRFDYKTFFAQKKRAMAVIIFNNGGGSFSAMGGNKKVCLNDKGKTDNKKCLTLKIPALFLSTNDGNDLYAAMKKKQIKVDIHCSYCHRNDMVLDWAKGKHSTAHANFGAEIHTSPELYNQDMVLTTPKEGCKKFSGKSYTGKIALVSRGSCRFDLKTYWAQMAGAKAIVIYNNGGSWNSNTIMGGNAKVNGVYLKIPSLFVGTNEGKKIVAEVNKAKSKSIKGSIHCN